MANTYNSRPLWKGSTRAHQPTLWSTAPISINPLPGRPKDFSQVPPKVDCWRTKPSRPIPSTNEFVYLSADVDDEEPPAPPVKPIIKQRELKSKESHRTVLKTSKNQIIADEDSSSSDGDEPIIETKPIAGPIKIPSPASTRPVLPHSNKGQTSVLTSPIKKLNVELEAHEVQSDSEDDGEEPPTVAPQPVETVITKPSPASVKPKKPTEKEESVQISKDASLKSDDGGTADDKSTNPEEIISPESDLSETDDDPEDKPSIGTTKPVQKIEKPSTSSAPSIETRPNLKTAKTVAPVPIDAEHDLDTNKDKDITLESDVSDSEDDTEDKPSIGTTKPVQKIEESSTSSGPSIKTGPNETTARKMVKAKKPSPSSLPPSIKTLIPVWPYPYIPYIPYAFLIYPIHGPLSSPYIPYISIYNPLPNLAKKRKIESLLVDSDDESSDD